MDRHITVIGTWNINRPADVLNIQTYIIRRSYYCSAKNVFNFSFYERILHSLQSKLIFEAFTHYFLSIFFFSLSDRPSETMKNIFHFIVKALFVLKYSNFCILFLPFHTVQIQKGKWKGNNLSCHKLACINLQM